MSCPHFDDNKASDKMSKFSVTMRKGRGAFAFLCLASFLTGALSAQNQARVFHPAHSAE